MTPAKPANAAITPLVRVPFSGQYGDQKFSGQVELPAKADASPILAWLRHPISLAIVGSLLSALLVPWISARMDDTRVIGEARLQRSLEILKNSTDTDRRFNSMITTMEMFIRDSTAAGKTTPKDVDLLRIDLARQYLELDRHAWWWYSNLPTEAKLLRIEVDGKILSELLGQYSANLIKTSDELNGLWTVCLENKRTLGQLERIKKETRGKMTTLQAERSLLMGQLVYHFSPKVPTIQRLLTQPSVPERPSVGQARPESPDRPMH